MKAKKRICGVTTVMEMEIVGSWNIQSIKTFFGRKIVTNYSIMILTIEMGKQKMEENLINKLQDAVKVRYLLAEPPQQRFWFFARRRPFQAKRAKRFFPTHHHLALPPFLDALFTRKSPGSILTTPTLTVKSVSLPRLSPDKLSAQLLQHLLFYRLFISTLITFYADPSISDRNTTLFPSAVICSWA